MFEAVASRLKTAAKAENCFKSPTLLHIDCFNIVAKFGIDEKVTSIVDELQICCKNLRFFRFSKIQSSSQGILIKIGQFQCLSFHI